MKWTKGSRSNIDDRRGQSGVSKGKLTAGGIVVLLIGVFLGRNQLTDLLDTGGSGGQSSGGQQHSGAGPGGPTTRSPDEEKLVDFISFVLDDLQTTWERKLPGYQRSTLVLFTGSTQSGCGRGTAAIGPFYCPADGKVYIDLSFYGALAKRFGAPGDFAQAYVLAHEIGHHIQNITGRDAEFSRLSKQNKARANDYSIRQELQADCLAGVWGHETKKRELLERGDVEEGLGAASAVGDDAIQKAATGEVHPESWTHGSSEQRKKWFLRGFDSGDVNACDTLSPPTP